MHVESIDVKPNISSFQAMKIFDNIGLGLFVISVVSVVLWSPRQHLVFHDLKPIPMQQEPNIENNNNVQQENNDNPRASQHNYPNWIEDFGNKVTKQVPHIEVNTEREEVYLEKDLPENFERHGMYGANTNFDTLTDNVDNENGQNFKQSATNFLQKSKNKPISLSYNIVNLIKYNHHSMF